MSDTSEKPRPTPDAWHAAVLAIGLALGGAGGTAVGGRGADDLRALREDVSKILARLDVIDARETASTARVEELKSGLDKLRDEHTALKERVALIEAARREPR